MHREQSSIDCDVIHMYVYIVYNIICVPLSLLSDAFSEDLLSAHESEIDRMRGFYKDNKEIFELVEKRHKLWEQQLELDVRS